MVKNNSKKFIVKSWYEITADIPELSGIIYPMKEDQIEYVINCIHKNNPYKGYNFIGPLVVISSAFFMFKKRNKFLNLIQW